MLPFKKRKKKASPDETTHKLDEVSDHTSGTPQEQAHKDASTAHENMPHAKTDTETNTHTDTDVDADAEIATQHSRKEKKGWFKKLRHGLNKTRSKLSDHLADVLLGEKPIDDKLLESLSDALISADIGVHAAESILKEAKGRLSRSEVQQSGALLQIIKEVMSDTLAACDKAFTLPKEKGNCILIIGINGAGKTTSIAKLAYRFQKLGKKVMLAAGDTFRAAAIEQLQTWGRRYDIPVVAQGHGADSAAVVYDAMEACKARNFDVLLADTAGRLHTQDHLIEELIKVKRVLGKIDETAPQATLLVLDATSGQNGIVQAKAFHQHIGVDGIILTKLDGSAKGGMIFSIAEELALPIYFIGIGEAIDDLQPFNHQQFIDALFADS